MTTTALDQRQRIIERLLTVNAKLDRATPELRLVLTDERDRLTRILARYDRGLIRIGQGLSTDVTARELVKELNRLNRELQRLSDSGDSTNQERLETQIAQLEDALFDLEDGWEKQPRHNGPPVYRRENPYPMGRPATDDSLILPSPDAPPLNASEINRMLGTLLGAQQAKRIYRNVDQFTVAMNRLNAFLDQSRWHTFLHPDNPFRLQLGAMNDLRSHYSNRGFNSPQDFIRDQEVAAERYADSGDASGLVLSLPLYQHRDALDAWISLEQSRIRDGGSQDCINSRFAEETAQAAWQALKQWAETAADIEQADADAAYMTRHLATPLRASLRAEGNDLVTLQMPAAASRPRF